MWLIASPFLVFLLAIVLLYLPPVQRFAVDKASAVASEMTGLGITVGRLDLRFPLDLLVRDVCAVEPETNDTLLSVERLKVELRFWKLFKKELEIEEISLRNATIDSRDFIDGMEVNGHLGEVFLESHGVIFSPETARLNEFSIKNTDLTLTLNELPPADTTASEPLPWKLILEKIALENVAFQLRMPKESFFLRTRLLLPMNRKSENPPKKAKTSRRRPPQWQDTSMREPKMSKHPKSLLSRRKPPKGRQYYKKMLQKRTNSVCVELPKSIQKGKAKAHRKSKNLTPHKQVP
jgi:hypothetical protein